jgi:hypothetical protein
LPDLFPSSGVPEITPDKLTAESLGAGILHHGCLIVRGLFAPTEAESLVKGIDKAIERSIAFAKGASAAETLPWYAPIPLPPKSAVALGRAFIQKGTGVLTGDSPRMLFELIEFIQQKRIDAIIAEYLGEQPVLSVGKSTLRRVPHTIGTTDWHQDGAFLGESVRTVNMWLALSRCGDEAPGLEIVPRRIDHIVETGTQGAHYKWSVGHGVAVDIAADKPIVSPIFMPGDAIFFDHLFLHRTGATPNMTKDRWAIETWFFAPSTYPIQQEPIVL